MLKCLIFALVQFLECSFSALIQPEFINSQRQENNANYNLSCFIPNISIILKRKIPVEISRFNMLLLGNCQNIDSRVLVVSNSRAFIPIIEFPFLLRRGDHTATE